MTRSHAILLILMPLAAAVFVGGIGWGLPWRAIDPLLFGTREPWSGQHILSLLPSTSDPMRAADVDVNPILDRSKPVVVNETDAQRAEIIQRYRLFSFQPDEMITFSALSGMKPAQLQLDPRLYQYGGLWIYPVGALLKLGSMVGYITLADDRAFYLDHPEAFGRFYVVARLYAVMWGLVGVWAVFWIARRASGSLVSATGAAACYIFMPVVVNMSHEAKPHLPGAVLMLCAIIAATEFVESGRTKWWILTSILCGAAAGMILSATIIIVILPLMCLLRAEPLRRRLSLSVLSLMIATVVYFLTNPYVAINLLVNRALIASNFSNTAAMYEFGRLGEGALNAVRLIREGASLGVLLCGIIGAAALATRAIGFRTKGDSPLYSPVLMLLAIPTLVICVQLAALGAGKPGEYGRFAILPDIALGIVATTAVAIFSGRLLERVSVTIVIVLLAALPGWFYLRGFIIDSSNWPTRYQEAAWLRALNLGGARTLGLHLEPAPYSLPPLDLFKWQLVLLPNGFDITVDSTEVAVIIRPVDAPGSNDARAGPFTRKSLVGSADLFPTRISWAGKSFEVWVRSELIEQIERQAASRLLDSP